jgi:hypothetical protein
VRPGPVSLGNCRAPFCFQPMCLARSHEEATTNGDRGDAGTRCAVAACAAAQPHRRLRLPRRRSPRPRQKPRSAIRELQEKMAAQQAQIDELKQQNAAKDAALSAAQSTAAGAHRRPRTLSRRPCGTVAGADATAAAQSQSDAVTSLKSTVTDLQGTSAGLAGTINQTKQDLNDKIDSPAAIHYKGVTITPVAFFAAEGVWRQHSVNSDVNTPFNTIPLPRRERRPRQRAELLRPAEPSGRAG